MKRVDLKFSIRAFKGASNLDKQKFKKIYNASFWQRLKWLFTGVKV